MDEEKSILVVDDDEDILSNLTFIFEKEGYQTETAKTGQEAIEKARKRFFNAALLDIKLPDMQGITLLAPLKKMHPDMAVMMISGYASLETAVAALNEGASAYITKPMNIDAVLAAIREVFEKQRLIMENRKLYQELQQELAERKYVERELQETLKKLRNALDGIIQAMTLTVEARDPYTAGHQRRVANLARAIAKEMGLREEKIDGIRIAGVIHDIGKIYIPAEILNKPGHLSEIEFDLIKTHAQLGYDILKNIEFPSPVDQIIYQHHERINGSGYPLGLEGPDILVEARILAVADVVEAMTSRRPYREALGIDKALEEISKNRGTLYDPDVVDTCLRLFTEKNFTLA